jgi:hypothetical protein
VFNLYNIVTGAQGGQAIDHLAQQFGLTPAQADETVKALIPAISTAFTAKLAHPGGLQAIAGALSDDAHKQAYADPGVAQDPSIQQKGGDIVASIFGSDSIVAQVVNNVAHYTGVPAATVERMLPVVVAIIVGGVAVALHNQNLGGFLNQLAGGLGGLFGTSGAPGQAGSGGFGSMFGNIFSQIAGGGQAVQPAPSAPAGPAPGPATGPAAGLPPMPPLVQAGMDAFGKMFEAGVKSHPAIPADLGAQISAIFRGNG